MQVVHQQNLTRRVIDWNAARYDRVFDYPLAASLLLEETHELYTARNRVELLDAIGDITFVSIGVMWKLGFTPERITEFLYAEDLRTMSMASANDTCNHVVLLGMDELDETMVGAYPGLQLAVFSLYITALGTLRGMGMQNYFYEVLRAVCDSNDTKAIAGKIDPTKKANVDKGQSFVPPDAALRAIEAAWKQSEAIRRASH